jgi:hypothetical protein
MTQKGFLRFVSLLLISIYKIIKYLLELDEIVIDNENGFVTILLPLSRGVWKNPLRRVTALWQIE